MTDKTQVRINDLCRELMVKAKLLIEYLPKIGVTDKKTHSSSIDLATAEKLRKHFRELKDTKAVAPSQEEAAKVAKGVATLGSNVTPLIPQSAANVSLPLEGTALDSLRVPPMVASTKDYADPVTSPSALASALPPQPMATAILGDAVKSRVNEDLIIKRFQERAGYRLADVAEVGLPVYSVNVQVLTLAHKRLPPVEEFLLRCLSMNLSSVDEISQYLGLTREVLKPAFANLAQTENIALTAQLGMQSWTLTKKGNATLQASEIIAPEQRTFQIHFDAILRKPNFYRYQKPLRYKELDEEGLIEIEIYPPKRPQPEEISPGDIERALKSVPGLTEQRRDVLAVRSIENIKKGFIRAVALLFKGANQNDVQLAFIIDGMLSTPHELAFARTEGFRRLITLITADPLEKGEVAATKNSVEVSGPRLSEAEEIDASTLHAEVRVAEQTEALRLAESEKEKRALLDRLGQAEKDLESLRTAAKQLPVRDIYVLDHPPLLQDALRQAKQRVMIISPWIRAAVVNQEFIKKLELLLQRKVVVYIGFGTSDEKDKTENLYDNDRLSLEKLRRLAEKYPNFRLERFGNTHAKVLIKDSEFVAVTSFNWLSFRGARDRTFRDEQGTLVQQPEYVDNKFNELVARFKKST